MYLHSHIYQFFGLVVGNSGLLLVFEGAPLNWQTEDFLKKNTEDITCIFSSLLSLITFNVMCPFIYYLSLIIFIVMSIYLLSQLLLKTVNE